MNSTFPCPSSHDPDSFPFDILFKTTCSSSPNSFNTPTYNKPHQKSVTRKRSKLVRIDASGTTSTRISKPKYTKKPDPNAPKITEPCSECGKKFWSRKALFGHMRCHPERQWRGIKPPPNLQQPDTTVKPVNRGSEITMFEDEHEVATCLIMLANGYSSCDHHAPIVNTTTTSTCQDEHNIDGAGMTCRFECSSCKKVFRSHQALGGHRASHKNVKGCFAIMRNGDGEIDRGQNYNNEEDHEKMVNLGLLGHTCSICLRVFSSGHALGGHMRCHWEKGDEPCVNHLGSNRGTCEGLDLNMPALVEDNESSSKSSYSSGLTLDLRLGL